MSKIGQNLAHQVTSSLGTFQDELVLIYEKALVQIHQILVKKYGIDSEELKEVLGMSNNEDEVKKEINDNLEEPTEKEILSMNVAELKALCKIRGLKRAGRKLEIISRLLGKEQSSLTPTPTPIRKTPRKKKQNKTESKVIKSHKKGTLTISQNKNGDYMHVDTGLIFDQNIGEVVSKFDENGENLALTVADIELCNQYRFPYRIPDNLDQAEKVETTEEAEESDFEAMVEDPEETNDKNVKHEEAGEEVEYEEVGEEVEVGEEEEVEVGEEEEVEVGEEAGEEEEEVEVGRRRRSEEEYEEVEVGEEGRRRIRRGRSWCRSW